MLNLQSHLGMSASESGLSIVRCISEQTGCSACWSMFLCIIQNEIRGVSIREVLQS